MITIAVAADRSYAKQVGVVLASLAATHPEPCRIFVLHNSFGDELCRRVADGAAHHVVRPIEVDTRRLDDVNVPPYLTLASVFRLLLPALLPDDVGRVLYLDADVMVRARLDELHSIDLQDHAVAAARDAVAPWVGSPRAMPWRALGLAPTERYFNTGVLLVDLERWRRQDVATRALDIMRRVQFRHGDQCALKAALGEDVLQLDPRWNLQAGHLLATESSAWLVEEAEALASALEAPAVVHFNTSPLGRPWQSTCTHPWRNEWLDALDRTSWAGWRPSRLREIGEQLREPHPARRILTRLQVAGRALSQGE
jgi:lipopolysaccharide biosynthesis glycosyltransferase